jgi:hypothetical protein
MPGWHLACDACEAEAWIGERADGRHGWCESCQLGVKLSPAGPAARPATLAPGSARPAVGAACPQCGRALALGEPRFEELYGELQHLAAVLAAWGGDAHELRRLLPKRPRFITDLNPPPAAADDSAVVREAIAALTRGAFAHARERLEHTASAESSARAARALAIACERLGDRTAAEAALDRAIARDAGSVLRLQRGALRARRRAFAGAREDLVLAGDGFEARWDRAVLGIAESLADSAGMPAPAVLEAARREAGMPSSDWSDHTVGRLLWSLLMECDPSPALDTLHAAEREFEFATFWDRAMSLEGYVRLGHPEDAARVAAPLALDQARRLGREPSLAAAAEISQSLGAAARSIEAGGPREARAALDPVLARSDLRRYCVPCRRCGRGSIGVDQVEDAGGAEEQEMESAP